MAEGHRGGPDHAAGESGGGTMTIYVVRDFWLYVNANTCIRCDRPGVWVLARVKK